MSSDAFNSRAFAKRDKHVGGGGGGGGVNI
jgi:hypothetical protein